MLARESVHALAASTVVSSSAASKQPVSASAHNMVGIELASRQERVPTQQTMPRPGTAGNGISGGLQMCQLECERHVRYANEEENLLAWRAWPIYSSAACHSNTRHVKRWPVVFAAVWTINYSLWVIDSNLRKLIQYISHCKRTNKKNALLSEWKLYGCSIPRWKFTEIFAALIPILCRTIVHWLQLCNT